MHRHPGIAAALAAALLFGASTPLAKRLLGEISPWMLAALLYAGSGAGLWLLRQARRAPSVRLPRAEWGWLGGAVVTGGVMAPVLLMAGLSAMPASTAALMLNAEGVFTALLAWFAFGEHFDRRIALGMGAIVAGAVVLSWPQNGHVEAAALWPSMAVLGACLCWAVDNNLTRKVSLSDASWIACVKGLAAGGVNLALAVRLGAALPAAGAVAGAAAVGFVCYGASLSLFVVALRHLGTARTGAYFSVAPFFGALLSLWLLGEPVTPALVAGGVLMAVGVALHLTEHHAHAHTHEAIEHEHEHEHGPDDPHHDHAHGEAGPEGPGAATQAAGAGVQAAGAGTGAPAAGAGTQDAGTGTGIQAVEPGGRHSHWHRHEEVTHDHHHYPDAHHLHPHP